MKSFPISFAILSVILIGEVAAQESHFTPADVSTFVELIPGFQIIDAFEFNDQYFDQNIHSDVMYSRFIYDRDQSHLYINDTTFLCIGHTQGQTQEYVNPVVGIVRIGKPTNTILRIRTEPQNANLIGFSGNILTFSFKTRNEESNYIVHITGDWSQYFETPEVTPTPISTPTPTGPPINVGDTTIISLDLPQGSTPLEMVLIREGSFIMGASEPAGDRDWPQHTVQITKPFLLGKYEVTQAQWESVMGNNPSYNSGLPNRPVERVSWNDCMKFVGNLNSMGIGEFRLPTEAEWEYAYRAGTNTIHFWGDDPGYEQIDLYMWHEGNNNPLGTKDVGTKLPNPWGLYDMPGNVYEWCSDWFESTYERGPQIDPQGPPTGTARIMRGGAWSYTPAYARASWRNWQPEEYKIDTVGFRLAMNYEIAVPTAIPTPTYTPTPTPTPTSTPTPTFTPTPFEPKQTTIFLRRLPNGAKPLQMVLLPPGTFAMGSPNGNESPQHEVTLSEPFYMSAYEYTWGQWQAVMGGVPPEYRNRWDDPVQNVSWSDCDSLIKQLNRQNVGTFRLPTEAEWEYACRAFTDTPYFWGDEVSQLDAYGWYEGNSFGLVKSIGLKLPNTFGLFDIYGNVKEWCEDRYGPYTGLPQVDPQGPASGNERVLRGGSWKSPADACRSAARDHAKQNERVEDAGLRLVRDYP